MVYKIIHCNSSYVHLIRNHREVVNSLTVFDIFSVGGEMYRSNAYKCEYNKPEACKNVFLSLK